MAPNNQTQVISASINQPRDLVLHVVGSPSSEFDFNLNIFYASSFDAGKHPGCDHTWAIIRPGDKRWAFVHDIGTIVDMNTRKLMKDVEVEWHDLPAAMTLLTTEVKPALVVPHLFCLEGATRYRCIMEALDIPLIGSSSQRAGMAMNKAVTRALMIQSGIPCPPGTVVRRDTIVDVDEIDYPCVVKPTTTENSIGITLVRAKEQMAAALEKAFKHSSEVIVDKFIPGREMRCSVVEKIDPFGNAEVVAFVPQEYHVNQSDLRKFDDKLRLDSDGLPLGKASTTKATFLSEEEEPELLARIQKLAVKTHRCLQFRDFSMVDVRVDLDGNPWILEVNLFSSFGPKSFLTIHAETIGWGQEDLFNTMLNNIKRRRNIQIV